MKRVIARFFSFCRCFLQTGFAPPQADESFLSQAIRLRRSGYIISLILFFLCSPSEAGTWAKTFDGANEDFGHSIQQTRDGGYILTGHTYSFGAGDRDVLVLRLDSSGNIVWQKVFGGADSDYGQSIQQTSGGGYILTGYTRSFGSGVLDFLVLRLDSSGSIVWQKAFGGNGADKGYSIQQTSDGGYILTGETASLGALYNDVLVLRLDEKGNIVWQRTFGEANEDRGYSIQQTSDGGYILTGYTGSFGAGSQDVLVLRLDSSGNIFGCGNFSSPNMTVNTPSVTVNSITSTVTNLTQPMADAGVTVTTPSFMVGTTCTYTGSSDDLVVDFGNFNAGTNVYYNNVAPWTSRHHWGPGAYNMVIGD
ncbi:MAG TPA: hypothetical protein ACFYED_08275, partial [Candidatus Tripitaka californicus]